MGFAKLPQNVLDSLCIVRTDLDNKIIYVSKGVSKLTGYSKDELIGQNPSIFRDPAVKDKIFENIWKSINNNNGFWNGIFRNRKKDGTIYFQNTNISKEFDENGKHIGYYAISTEISKTIENPYEFIFESNLFDLFFSSNQDIGAVCSCKSVDQPDARLLDISIPFVKLLNTTKEYILGNNLSFVDIVSKDSKYYKNLDKLMEDYNQGNDIIVYIDAFGLIKKRYICKLDIITFEYHDNLLKFFKITDLTKEFETNKKLKELDQAKNSFLANFSHEIRTPLNATIGFIELMKEETSNPTLLEYINIVLDNSRHLLEMMNDVIDFTSIDNDNFEIIPREFSLKDIQSTIEIFYAKSLEKEIDFNVYLSPQLPERMTQDILRIKQIISNLLSNSLKFRTGHIGKLFK